MWALVFIPVFAAIEVAGMFALFVGVLGLSSIIFSALKYNRDDTGAIVQQQSTIMADMRSLNDELRITADTLRKERDALQGQVEELTQQIKNLQQTLE